MDILLTGSVAFDYLMTFPGRFRENILPDKLDQISLSFLVDSMVRLRGGIAPNIAYNMSLLGGKPRLFATVGEDFSDYGAWLNQCGIDTSLVRVIPNVQTASFFANTDRDNNQIASFFPGAMAYAAELSFYDLDGQHPDLVVISPNDPVAMKRYVRECQELFIPYLYDPSQQVVRLESEALQSGIEGCKYLFANEYEWALIQKKSGLSIEEMQELTEMIVVTLGEGGSVIFTDGDQIRVPAIRPHKEIDPTGVGDAFRGGFLTGLARGWSWELCAQVGALAATFCLERAGPQAHRYSTPEFIERFRLHFDDGGVLDKLLEDAPRTGDHE